MCDELIMTIILQTEVLVAAHSEDFVILACTVLIQCNRETDRRLDNN